MKNTIGNQFSEIQKQSDEEIQYTTGVIGHPCSLWFDLIWLRYKNIDIDKDSEIQRHKAW